MLWSKVIKMSANRWEELSLEEVEHQEAEYSGKNLRTPGWRKPFIAFVNTTRSKMAFARFGGQV